MSHEVLHAVQSITHLFRFRKLSMPYLKRVILNIILIFSVVVTGNIYIYKPIQQKKVYINNLKLDLAELKTKYAESQRKVMTLTEENITIPKNYKGNKKIVSYINKYYKRVPKSVAIMIANTIIYESRLNHIKPAIIVAIIEEESAFNPYLISKRGCRGLMQVNFVIWKEELGLVDRSELHEISSGISIGVKIFKRYLDETKGNLSKALYLYVGKDKYYKKAVLTSMGKFSVFREEVTDARN